jgi:peptide/nickel transport system permease protein
MLSYLTRRIALGLLTVWAVSVLSFAIIELPPGDFVTSSLSRLERQRTPVSEAEIEQLRRIYGLDQPLVVQYGRWVGQIAQGNFGWSLSYGAPVGTIIGDRLPLTAIVTIAAILFTWVIAVPIGIYSAVRKYSLFDYTFTIVGFLGFAVPSFLLALVLMYLGVVVFDLKVGGLFSAELIEAPWSWHKVWDLIQHLPLPALVLGLAGAAELMRVMRANLLDELPKPYVFTARAKGLAERSVIVKYPVRVALGPFASTAGFFLPEIVSGSIILSVVMSLPTLGPVLLTALLNQDMFLAGAIMLMIGIMTVVGILLSDLLLVWVDPRVRLYGRG